MKKVIALLLLFGWSSVSAAPVTWTLDGVVLEQALQGGGFYYGAGLTGSFVYDADTNTFSDVEIYSEPGVIEAEPTWVGGTYYETNYLGEDDLSGTSTSLSVWQQYFDPGCTFGEPYPACESNLSLTFLDPLTNSGGTVSLDTVVSVESFFVSFGSCGFRGCLVDTRKIISGSVSAVPIPAAAWLLGSALVGLGWLRREKAA